MSGDTKNILEKILWHPSPTMLNTVDLQVWLSHPLLGLGEGTPFSLPASPLTVFPAQTICATTAS